MVVEWDGGRDVISAGCLGGHGDALRVFLYVAVASQLHWMRVSKSLRGSWACRMAVQAVVAAEDDDGGQRGDLG